MIKEDRETGKDRKSQAEMWFQLKSGLCLKLTSYICPSLRQVGGGVELCTLPLMQAM